MTHTTQTYDTDLVAPRVIRRVSANATGYTVIATLVEAQTDDESEALTIAGFGETTILYAVLAPSTHLLDYDKYRLVRALPGDADWILDELHAVEDDLRAEASGR
jgi:hypothetical protein